MTEHAVNPQATRQLILMVTLDCNLRCKYCYERYKRAGKMPVSTAKEIFERELTSPRGKIETRDFLVDFFGGEPLDNFDLIREVCEWLWRCEWRYPYKLRIRTNGTLLTDEMRSWFATNRSRIEVALSLDGFGEMQARNRGLLVPDAAFFAENWPGVRAKLVLFPDSIHLLRKAVASLRENGLPFEVDVGAGFEWTNECARELESQLAGMIPNYALDVGEAVESKLFPFSPASFFPPDPPARYPFCGHVSNIVAYDIDGRDYCCHMFTPVVQGRELAERSRELCKIAQEFPLPQKCRECPLVNNCKLCYADNLRICGDIAQSAAARTTCLAVKAQGRASARLYLENVRFRVKNGFEVAPDDLELTEKSLRLLREVALDHV